MKEKFKLIKKALKEWHVSHILNLSAKITDLKERQGAIDGKGEDTKSYLMSCDSFSFQFLFVYFINAHVTEFT